MSSASLAALDASAFAELRRALHVHCYRMLGSLDDAEDVVQESLLRAWLRRNSLQCRAALRGWRYRIATNACLDALRRRKRRVLAAHVIAPNTGPVPTMDVDWLAPYPDQWLDQIASADDRPESVVVERESIELTFVAALQLLPPRQRAALIVCDVLDWSAVDTAALLETSVASVNSMVQRARATVRERRPIRSEWPAVSDAQERAVVEQFMRACERADAHAVIALLDEQVRCAMPPYPWWFEGRAATARSFVDGFRLRPGDFRCVLTRANRQPAVATYLRAFGDSEFRPFAMDVIRVEGGRIADITAFHVPGLFAAFGVPEILH